MEVSIDSNENENENGNEIELESPPLPPRTNNKRKNPRVDNSENVNPKKVIITATILVRVIPLITSPILKIILTFRITTITIRI